MNTESASKNLESAVPMDAALKRVESLLGLRYQQHQWSDLLRLLKPAARELGFDDVSRCVAWLATGTVAAEQVHILGKHLTIGESYFFREIVVFSHLKEFLLPELIKQKEKHGDNTLRIWSAGCSTGEEVYSLAILLDSFLKKSSQWNFSITGTDVNHVALDRARSGQYRAWSFRDLPDGILDTYFTRLDDGKYEIAEHIRDHTTFKYCNLAEAPTQYPTGYDIVLCRNVLMYFTRAKIREIVQGFRSSLREGGWLIPSLTETTLINNPGFEGVRFGDATLFRKQQQIAKIIPLRNPPEEESAKTRFSPIGESSVSRESFASILPFRSEDNDVSSRPQPSTKPQRGVSPDTVAVKKPEGTTHMMHAKGLDHGGVELPKPDENREEELIHIARTLADQGLLEDACSAARLAVEAAKMNPQSHFMYATILREIGETSESIKEFHRALYLDNGFVPAHFALGSLYQHLGDTPRGHRHLRNAYDLLQNSRESVMMSDTSEMSPRRMLEIIRSMLGEV